ncbi:MAG: GNAT family N-acetyltransferase [Sulfitobacter sp.]
MVIRQAQAKDISDIQSCAEEAYAQYVAAIGKKPAPMVADFVPLIAAKHVHVFVDKVDSLLGFVVFFPKADHMFLENVALRQDATGKGVGKQLIGYCETQAKQAGLGRVRLYTNEKMTANLSLYPHLGYRETHRKKEDGFNRVFFEKTI